MSEMTLVARLRGIFRRRRIRKLTARAKDSAAKALAWMQFMEDDLQELRMLSAGEPRIFHLTELEIEAAIEGMA